MPDLPSASGIAPGPLPSYALVACKPARAYHIITCRPARDGDLIYARIPDRGFQFALGVVEGDRVEVDGKWYDAQSLEVQGVVVDTIILEDGETATSSQ